MSCSWKFPLKLWSETESYAFKMHAMSCSAVMERNEQAMRFPLWQIHLTGLVSDVLCTDYGLSL